MEPPRPDTHTPPGSTVPFNREATLKTHLTGALMFAALAALALMPAPAAAEGDCGADYVRCVAESVDHRSSDVLHETECYSGYWHCVSKLILLF